MRKINAEYAELRTKSKCFVGFVSPPEMGFSVPLFIQDTVGGDRGTQISFTKIIDLKKIKISKTAHINPIYKHCRLEIAFKNGWKPQNSKICWTNSCELLQKNELKLD